MNDQSQPPQLDEPNLDSTLGLKAVPKAVVGSQEEARAAWEALQAAAVDPEKPGQKGPASPPNAKR